MPNFLDNTNINTANSTPATLLGKPAPMILTSRPAEEKLAEVKNTLADLTNNISTQAANKQVAAQNIAKTAVVNAPKAPAEATGAASSNTLQEIKKLVTPNPAGVSESDSRFWMSNPDREKNIADLNAGKINLAATPSGTETPKTPEKTETQKALDDLNAAKIKTLEEEAANKQKQLDDIKNGVFALNPEEQAQVDSMKAIYDKAIAATRDANMRYQQELAVLGQATGASRYTGETQMGVIHDAIDKGAAKVSELEVEMTGKIAALKTALRDKRYSDISKLYKDITANQDERIKTLSETQKTIADQYKELQVAKENARKDQEANQKVFETALPALEKQLTGGASDAALYKQWSKQYGLSEDIVKGLAAGAVEKNQAATEKQDQALLLKGFRTISPADAEKLRKEGYTVQTLGGRAYAKAPTMKVITVGSGKSAQKFNVYYDANNKEIKREKISGPTSGGTGGGGGTGGITKSQMQQIQNNLSSVRGSDTFVHPDDYLAARNDWIRAGGNPTVFDTKMKGFRNPNNPDYITNKQ